jgi:hypothetical protein
MQVEQFKIKDIGKPFKKIGDVAKDAGGAIADTSKKAGGAIVDTSKKAGGGIKDAANVVKDKAEDVGGGIKNVGKGIGGFAKNVGKGIGEFGKKIGGVFKSIFTKLWKFLLFLFKNWRIVLSVICGLCILSVVARVASIGRLLGLGRVFSGRAAMRQRPPMMMSTSYRGGYN